MTETEDLLTKYNVDSRNRRLRDYYEADNLWRTLRIERDENKHSAFIAWLLGKEANSANSSLYKFLNLIIRTETTDPRAEYNELKKSILLCRLRINSAQITTERSICALSQIRYNDRIDIYAECEISGVGVYTRLEIFIENKIGSGEGKRKTACKISAPTPREQEYLRLEQTQRYYLACGKENRLRKQPFDENRTLQLFVFLTANRQPPAEEHFVTITYQNLVDFILEPYLQQEDIDAHTTATIKEYLRILGNPINNDIIMATTSEEKELLIDFYKRNEDLFRRALEVMRDNADTEEEEKEYTTMLASMSKSRTRRFFSLNGSDKKYMMYEIVAEFVKFLRRGGLSFEQIEQKIRDYTKEPSQCHISTNRSEVKRGEKSFEAEFEGTTFYVTKEWGRGLKGRNFDGLLLGIKEDYPAFDIQEK